MVHIYRCHDREPLWWSKQPWLSTTCEELALAFTLKPSR